MSLPNPNSKGQYRVNYMGLIHIATTIDKEIFTIRNHKGDILDVVATDLTFFPHFKPHQ